MKLQYHCIRILGGRYLALFDQRKSSCHRLITRYFSLLRRGCSLDQCSFPLVRQRSGITFLRLDHRPWPTGPRLFRRLDDTEAGVTCALLLALDMQRHSDLTFCRSAYSDPGDQRPVRLVHLLLYEAALID